MKVKSFLLLLLILITYKLSIAQRADSLVYNCYYNGNHIQQQLKLYCDSTFYYSFNDPYGEYFSSGFYTFSNGKIILNSYDFYKDTAYVMEFAFNDSIITYSHVTYKHVCILEIDKNFIVSKDSICFDRSVYSENYIQKSRLKNVIGFQIFRNGIFYKSYFLKNSNSTHFAIAFRKRQVNYFYCKDQILYDNNNYLILKSDNIEKYFYLINN
jgi:hypothetical protein